MHDDLSWIAPMRPKVCDEGIAVVIDDARLTSANLEDLTLELERINENVKAAGLSDIDREGLDEMPKRLAYCRELIARQISNLEKYADGELSRRVNQNTQFPGE